MQLNAWLQVQLLDLVVGDPELFKGLANVFETLESSDVVAAEGENFKVLQAGKGDHLLDGVSGEGELGDVLELIERVIELVDWEWKLADEVEFSDISWRLTGLLFPTLDCLFGCERH